MTLAEVQPTHVPDGIQPIVGYRLWRLDAQERTLLAFGGERWSPEGWTRAICRPRMGRVAMLHGPTEVPREGCGCGLYAVKSLDALIEIVVGGAGRPILGSAVLMGTVELAGKVIEHELGYRASHGRVVELFPFPSQFDLAERLACRYKARVPKQIIPLENHSPGPPSAA